MRLRRIYSFTECEKEAYSSSVTSKSVTETTQCFNCADVFLVLLLFNQPEEMKTTQGNTGRKNKDGRRRSFKTKQGTAALAKLIQRHQNEGAKTTLDCSDVNWRRSNRGRPERRRVSSLNAGYQCVARSNYWCGWSRCCWSGDQSRTKAAACFVISRGGRKA